MDECGMNLASCPDHASCVNLPGTYFCNCTQGYAPIGHPLEKCVDINECELNIHTCAKEQMCQNTVELEFIKMDLIQFNSIQFDFRWDPIIASTNAQRATSTATVNVSILTSAGSSTFVIHELSAPTCPELTNVNANQE